MSNLKEKLTTVKVDPILYKEFKQKCIIENFTLKKLVSRAIFLYITDKDFREKIHLQ